MNGLTKTLAIVAAAVVGTAGVTLLATQSLNEQAAAPSPTPTPLAPPVVPKVAWKTYTLNSSEKALRTSINAYRATHGLPPLAGYAPLNALAHDHAVANAANQTITHSTWRDFVGYTGGLTRAFGENAAIAPDRTWALNKWKTMEDANALLLDPDLTAIGLAYSNWTMPDLQEGRFWVVDFATAPAFVGNTATLTSGETVSPVLMWWGE